MASVGAWEVDAPQKGGECTACGAKINPGAFRFRWRQLGTVSKAAAAASVPQFHADCALTAGAAKPKAKGKKQVEPSYAPVSHESVRKVHQLPSHLKDLLRRVLDAGTVKAARSLLNGAGGEWMTPATASAEGAAKRGKALTAQGAKAEEDTGRKRGPLPIADGRAMASSGRRAGRSDPAAASPEGAVGAEASAGTRKRPAASSWVGVPTPSKKARTARGPSSRLGMASKGSTKAKAVLDTQRLEEQIVAFQSWTVEKLKKLLQKNDQSRSGNKAVLVAKCADGATFGRLPRCPKCHGGKIKFRVPGPDGKLQSLFRALGGASGEDKEDDLKEDAVARKRRYYCTGYFDDDEKQDCSWQADTVPREPWEDL